MQRECTAQLVQVMLKRQHKEARDAAMAGSSAQADML